MKHSSDTLFPSLSDTLSFLIALICWPLDSLSFKPLETSGLEQERPSSSSLTFCIRFFPILNGPGNACTKLFTNKDQDTANCKQFTQAPRRAVHTSSHLPLPHRNPNRTLNDLPDELLLHILTFFPTLDAVQTCLISWKWSSLWLRLRFLKFSYQDFPLNDPPSDNRDFFAECIDRFLISRPQSPPIDLFSLSFIYHDRFGFHVDSWVRSAITLLRAR